ncbi:hypothetical protein GGR56DRAFT_677918 [Xylariaceae sp. FL0804]|nr:hypothetical protein GGR56DRAFT_677918 [Xylariaceae sp. FL0804]
MSAPTDYTSMPSSMSPPSDLISYARSMHLHTKRQMEAGNIGHNASHEYHD